MMSEFFCSVSANSQPTSWTEDITNNRLRKKYTVLVSYASKRTKGAALVHCLKKDHKLRLKQLYNVYLELLNSYSCNYFIISSPPWKSPSHLHQVVQNVKKSKHIAPPLQPKANYIYIFFLNHQVKLILSLMLVKEVWLFWVTFLWNRTWAVTLLT